MTSTLILHALIPVSLLIVTGIILFKLNPKNILARKTILYHLTFYSLVAATVIGFFFDLDNNQNSGCIISDDSIFATKNAMYSITSLALLIIAYLTRQRKYQLLIFSSEFMFWLVKFLFLKGGYSVGYIGEPMQSIVLFDSVALALRFALIMQIAQRQIKTFIVLLIVLLITFNMRGHFI